MSFKGILKLLLRLFNLFLLPVFVMLMDVTKHVVFEPPLSLEFNFFPILEHEAFQERNPALVQRGGSSVNMNLIGFLLLAFLLLILSVSSRNVKKKINENQKGRLNFNPDLPREPDSDFVN